MARRGDALSSSEGQCELLKGETRPLTAAHKALIALLAEIAVEQYLAEEEEP
jgi:hypothetical protein